jgi:hypothetical protein
MAMSVREYYLIFTFACVAAVVVGAGVSAVRRVRAGKPLLRPVATSPRFSETWFSGRSLRTTYSRFLGARNCVWVTVTSDELWTGLHFPFNLLAVNKGLEHRVRGADIVAVEGATLLPVFTRVVVRFRRGPDGGEDAIELAVRDRDAFRRALVAIGAPHAATATTAVAAPAT